MKIKNIEIFGDAELIIKQVNRQYQAKHPRLRTYRNCVWDLVENFFTSVNFHFVPRSENQQADALAKDASMFSPPTNFNLKYHIQMSIALPYLIMYNIGKFSKMMSNLENFLNL
jgi:hypothetical protein